MYEEKLSKIIQHETVSKIGQTDLTKFLEFHKLLKSLFPKLFEVCEYENINGSMLLKWPSGNAEPSKPVLFMNHTDVVEASGAWKYPPFSGEIAEDKVWGRGTQDTKGGLFIMLQAAEELVEEGFKPNHDIYFESACNEEISGIGANEISMILKERGVDFEFVYDEGGKIMKTEEGLVAQIGVAEKAVVELEFVAKSSGGHASRPPKNTPLVRLGRFMAAVDDTELFSEKLVEETGEYEKTTIAFTMASGSNARNVIPTSASVICSMRCSHHQGTDESINIVTEFAKKFDVEVNVLFKGLESPISETSGPVFDKISKSIKEIYPDVKIEPFLMQGATDSNYFTRICKDVYRFTPLVVSEEQENSVHSINENVDVDALAPAIKSYKLLMKM